MNHLWVRCDLSVLEVDCPHPGCGSKIGEPCFFPASSRDSLRMTPLGGVITKVNRPAEYKGGEGHAARRKAASKRRAGRAKIGVPVTLEVDMESGKVTLNALVPNLAGGHEEEER